MRWRKLWSLRLRTKLRANRADCDFMVHVPSARQAFQNVNVNEHGALIFPLHRRCQEKSRIRIIEGLKSCETDGPSPRSNIQKFVRLWRAKNPSGGSTYSFGFFLEMKLAGGLRAT